jgi:hypothetical protein
MFHPHNEFKSQLNPNALRLSMRRFCRKRQRFAARRRALAAHRANPQNGLPMASAETVPKLGDKRPTVDD